MEREREIPLPLVWGIRVSNETQILFSVTPSPVSLLMSYVNEREKKKRGAFAH